MTPIVERHFEDLKSRHPLATCTAAVDGSFLIYVPDVALQGGWNKDKTNIWFIAPVGYPFSTPDCFWGDADLRLASGVQPQASQPQQMPVLPQLATWFSWHVQVWNPNRDTLFTYFNVILGRLQQAI